MPACPGTALTCSKSHISTTDSSFLREIHTAYAQPEPLTVIRSSQRAPPKLISLLFFIVLWGPSSGSTSEPGPLLELALAGASAISKENSSNMFFRPQHGNNNKCLTTHQSLLNNNRSHTQRRTVAHFDLIDDIWWWSWMGVFTCYSLPHLEHDSVLLLLTFDHTHVTAHDAAPSLFPLFPSVHFTVYQPLTSDPQGHIERRGSKDTKSFREAA